jgi:asparaginyl-tRNA synthetase
MIIDIKKLYENDYIGKEVTLQGWIRSHRKQKEFGFIDFYDGTCFKSIQVVYESDIKDFDNIQKFRVGSAVTVDGIVVESPGAGRAFEVKAKYITLEGDSPEEYPIQPKRHTREYLREVAYLRPRTNLFQAVFRVRSIAAQAIHTYFQERGYVYLHAPLITGSDAEGAGEMFQVTTIDLNKIPRMEDKKIDYTKDFFGKKS